MTETNEPKLVNQPDDQHAMMLKIVAAIPEEAARVALEGIPKTYSVLEQKLQEVIALMHAAKDDDSATATILEQFQIYEAAAHNFGGMTFNLANQFFGLAGKTRFFISLLEERVEMQRKTSITRLK